jgi:hypothetical protein
MRIEVEIDFASPGRQQRYAANVDSFAASFPAPAPSAS